MVQAKHPMCVNHHIWLDCPPTPEAMFFSPTRHVGGKLAHFSQIKAKMVQAKKVDKIYKNIFFNLFSQILWDLVPGFVIWMLGIVS